MTTPAYHAGIAAARQSAAETVKWIMPPDTYTVDERSDFVSGFVAGAKAIAEEGTRIADHIADDTEIERRLAEEDADRDRRDNERFGVDE